VKKIVTVTYQFEVEYKHVDHLNNITQELIQRPINSMAGAGEIHNGTESHGYSCKRIGKGIIEKGGGLK